ncbi:MAG TPA: hypothetical protein DCX32_02770 [Candidatus Moranbacteria bacterium]|nr:MAG: hypothetical protein UW95_C0004G0046 [Parcubacteria group bacterium GW2011_GWC1_45_14]HAV11442.1 hypothetical protein [Candidatus Moranbacteria bacterium]
MNEKEYQFYIVELLAKNEDKLSELYALYGEKFTFMKKFWDELTEDELGHGRWVKTLKKKVEEGAVQFGEHRFDKDMLEDFYKSVQLQIFEANKEINVVDALKNAVKIEQTMIEKRFFDVFKGDSVELEILLLALRYSTENHLKSVTERYKSEVAGMDSGAAPQAV